MPSPPSLPPYLKASPKHQKSLGEHLSPILTGLSHLSTPFISTFLLIHLAAPTVATLGGSSLSSQVILLGREYYQGSYREPWLLFGPLSVHVSAAILKRLLSPAPIPQHLSLLTLTAYPLLFFLPIHVITHRFLPSDPSPPILALSPSELDFEFVKAGLAWWPVRSWVLYTGLVVCGLTHAFEGWDVVLRTWVGSKGIGKKRRRLSACMGVLAVLFGLRVVTTEPLLLLRSTISRVHASYSSLLAYRI